VSARPAVTVPDAIAAVVAAEAEDYVAARTLAGPLQHGEYVAIGHAVVAGLRGAGWHITPHPALEVPTVTHTPCPACRQPKAASRYLCLACWSQLSDAARRALSRRDTHAMARLRDLHRQLEAGVPPAEVTVSP
jgi:hypothetical protein